MWSFKECVKVDSRAYLDLINKKIRLVFNLFNLSDIEVKLNKFQHKLSD